jgi:rare lipoprotein A
MPEDELVGIASWYGHPYHGRRASNGETYNMNSLTAAHRTLPFDTLVNVHNLENGKEVEVRINDRGPFVQGRIIDLSHAAAKQIDMIGPGTAKVRLELIRSVANPYPLTIQVGAFKEKKNAEMISTNLRPIYPVLEIGEFESEKGTFYRVLVGQFKGYSEAHSALRDLQRRHYEGFVVRLDPR